MPAGLAVMVVEAAGIAFALPALAVAHVTAPVPVTPLPSVPGYVDGLVGLGGRILPQIDLRRRLALPAAAAGAAGDLVVVMADEGSYALRVDRVVTVTTVAPDVIPVFEAGPASGGTAARCLDGAGACPPEDCGGIYGYVEMLKALKNPKHPEHKSMKEWLGGRAIDPKSFDLAKINFWLGKLKWPRVTEIQLRKVLMGRDNYTEG